MDVVNGVVAAASDFATAVVTLSLFLLTLFRDIIISRNWSSWPGVNTTAAIAPATRPTLNGPIAIPIFGAMYVMASHRYRPFRRFTELSRRYGPVYSMPMGKTPCVIVNDFASIKEVLITNGSKFGGRTDFIRYNVLFAGDRNNSLALCDWSELQEARRRVARTYCSPKYRSFNYGLLNTIVDNELDVLLAKLAVATDNASERSVYVKPLLGMSTGNVFLQFMCSIRFTYDDGEFQSIVRTFDEIFWEINQGCALDFLPWLKPFYWARIQTLSSWSSSIRRFIMEKIVSKRISYARATAAAYGKRAEQDDDDDDDDDDDNDEDDDDRKPADFTDALIMALRNEPTLKMDHVLFELEDFLGGHSAVANLIMLTLSLVATRPHVAQAIRDEVIKVTSGQRRVCLYDKPNMPYTEATLFETLRMVSSPIVPHVATEKTSIAGYQIAKGTCVIINNFELNTSPKLWHEPEVFEPERFVKRNPGTNPSIWKPEHFIPFSTGKRTCIGQQLVSGTGFVFLAGILWDYEVKKATGQMTIPESQMALPTDTHALIFKPINRSQ